MCTSKTVGKGRAMARDSGVLQGQHFCHHGDTICHPKSELFKKRQCHNIGANAINDIHIILCEHQLKLT